MPEPDEILRPVMRHWTTGVAVVTSVFNGQQHGLTASSLTSISLNPPLISLTLSHLSRTYALALQSRVLAVTILSDSQQEISVRFAGQHGEMPDRFAGLDTFILDTGAPFITGGLAFLDCKIILEYPMPESTLFIAEVVAGYAQPDGAPLIYHNRAYHHLKPDD